MKVATPTFASSGALSPLFVTLCLLLSLVSPLQGTARAATGAVLIVVGDTNSITSGDDAVRDRLESAANTVTIIDDSIVQPQDASAHDLVLVASSVSAATLGTKLSSVATPVVVANPWSLDEFEMAPSGPHYGSRRVSSIEITNPGHPTAAGLQGSVALSSGSTYISWANPAPSAIISAEANGDPTIFNIEPGAALADGTIAPSCRLHFPLYKNAASGYNDDAWTLFDATIEWGLANCAAGPIDEPPEIQILSPESGSVISGTITIVANAIDDFGVVETRFYVDDSTIGVDTDGSDGWSIGWDSATFPEGSSPLTAQAIDTVGQATTSSGVFVTVDNLPDDDPPSVTIMDPPQDATVQGPVVIVATADDDEAVSQVAFHVDSNLVGVDTTSVDGWSILWDSTTVPDGRTLIRATATDTVGQSTTSDPVGVEVDNIDGASILFVVGNDKNLTSGDLTVRDRLVEMGHSVTPIDDATVTLSDTFGHHMVLVASSVSSGALNSKLAPSEVPVLVAKPWLLDDFDMAERGPNYGSLRTDTILIVDAGHPAAGGFSGTVSISGPDVYLSWATPVDTATVVGTANSTPTIFSIQSGEALADGSPAPGCRLHFPLYKTAPTRYSENAWALFAASVDWGLSGCESSRSDSPPTVAISSPQHGDVITGTTDLSAIASDDNGVDHVEFFANGLSVGADVNASDGWSVPWNSNAHPDGAQTITATATDTIGQTATSAGILVSVDNETGPNPPIGDEAERVIFVFVDGLRSDIIENLGVVGAPALHRLITEGATTLNARTVFEQTRTLPNSASMFTGYSVDLPDGHGVDFNADNGETIHDTADRYVPSIFDAVHDAGGRTVVLSAKVKLDFFDRSWNEASGAPDVTGTDDGKDKIDVYNRESSGQVSTTSLLDQLSTDAAHLTVLHFREPDVAGHEFGYTGVEYEAAVSEVDGFVGQILAFFDANPDIAAGTALVLTTDHGGLGTSHADPGLPDNYTIPFMVWGAGVDAGDLYVLNPASRTNPGVDRPDYGDPTPVRNADVANLITDLLGLPPIAASTVNSDQSLRFEDQG